MIIGITGYAQSGKDTVATTLVEKYGFERRAFADKIREILYELNPMVGGEPLQIKVDVEGWEKAKQHSEVRRLLQKLGVSARIHIHDKVWINPALSNMDINKHYVITDVRFLNEARALHDIGAYIWRVTRLGVGPVNNHVSESQMDEYVPDLIIPNDGTLDDLDLLIKTRMQGLL